MKTSHRIGFTYALATVIIAMSVPLLVAQGAGFAEAIAPLVEREYASLEKLYTHCHSWPQPTPRKRGWRAADLVHAGLAPARGMHILGGMSDPYRSAPPPPSGASRGGGLPLLPSTST